MDLPAIILGIVLGALYGTLFFLAWPQGSYRRLLMCLAASWFGFLLGQVIANLSHFGLWKVGAINLGGATLGSLVALVALRVLGLQEWK
ncbi:MAG: hypothetical protein ABSF61_03475 [Anaerolineales bacterium]|jgi:hypothetical protein